MDFEDQMIEAVERGECSEDEAYDHVRESMADAADRARDEEQIEQTTRRFNALRDKYRNGRFWPEERDSQG
jgi:hypothetical protein